MVPAAAEVRGLWALEHGARHLNHGAFGATPRPLLAAQAEWRARMERQPSRFFINDLGRLLRDSAAALAGFLGTAPGRLGLVDNATTAINAVLASAPLRAGDEVLTTDHVYGAVRHALRHHAGRASAVVVEAPVGMPVASAGAVLDAVLSRITPRTRLLVVDHVASPSAVVMPVAEMVGAARRAGVPVLVDGAHAPGLLELDLDALGADFYAGNLHKWLCAPKGAAFLALGPAAPWPVHPLVISHAYGQGFTAEFDKTGTRDPTAWLTVPDALALHARLGGAALRARNAALARDAAGRIAAELGEPLGAPAGLFAAMATIRVPGALPADWPTAGRLRDALWDAARIEAPVMALGGALWLRVSAAAYNEAAEYDGVAAALRDAVARLAA